MCHTLQLYSYAHVVSVVISLFIYYSAEKLPCYLLIPAWTCLFAVCNVLKIIILVQAFHCSALIVVIDNNIQTHTTLFFLSSKLSVKAVQLLISTIKLCSLCTIAARSYQLSQQGVSHTQLLYLSVQQSQCNIIVMQTEANQC